MAECFPDSLVDAPSTELKQVWTRLAPMASERRRGGVCRADRCGVLRRHNSCSSLPHSLSRLPLTLSSSPQDADMLACHNYWHWALYLIEKVKMSGDMVFHLPQHCFVE